MNPPPNPNADAARAAMQSHNAQVRLSEFQELLERTFARWPDMERYADTARVETNTAYRNGEWVMLQVVTVTVFDKRKGES